MPAFALGKIRHRDKSTFSKVARNYRKQPNAISTDNQADMKALKCEQGKSKTCTGCIDKLDHIEVGGIEAANLVTKKARRCTIRKGFIIMKETVL